MFALRAVALPIRNKIITILNTSAYSEPAKKINLFVPIRTFASDKKDTMVDPKRVLSYDDMLRAIDQPKRVIIDVRNPDEVDTTGKIPSSINIPLSNVQDVLMSMSNEEFKRQYQRSKPSSSDELIFYCQSGRRSSEALDKALKLGYSKSKTYLGSWNEWSTRQK